MVVAFQNYYCLLVPGVTRCILSLIDFPWNRVRVRVILPVPGTGVPYLKVSIVI